jgi:hypothetical protein
MSGVRFSLIVPVLFAVAAPPTVSAELLWTHISEPDPNMAYYHRLAAGKLHLYTLVNDGTDSVVGMFRRPIDAQSSSGWERLTDVPGQAWGVAVAGPNDEHLLVSTREGLMWYSSDGGASWVDRSQGLPEAGSRWRVAMDDSGWTYVTNWETAETGYSIGIGYSDDFEANWEYSEWCSCVSFPFWEVVVSPLDPTRAFACHETGFFEQAVRSARAGDPWDRIALPWEPVMMPADLVADPHANRLYFQLSNRIWWFDGLEYAGETRPSFKDHGHMGLAASPFDPGAIYAAGKMQVGVDVKRATYDLPTAGGDHYANWTSMRDGLPETQVPDPTNQTMKYNLEAAPTVPKLYLSVLGLGLFEREIEVETSNAPEHVTRLDPWVSLPAPNPTVGAVQWSLQLDQAQPIGISIVDAGGRVRFQSRLWRSAGSHELGPEVSSTLETLPQGVYQLLVDADGSTSVRRITIVR